MVFTPLAPVNSGLSSFMAVAANPQDGSGDGIHVDPIRLTQWIASRPDLGYLVKAAKESRCLYDKSTDTLSIAPPEDVVGKKNNGLWVKFREVFWPSASSMRGKAYASEEFDGTCSRAANMMAGSTLWDGISTVPFVQFALINYLKWAALPAAVGISLGLMLLSNVAGRLGVNRSAGKGLIANTGLSLFILLSLAKTLLSGVGFDILVNQDGITREYAKKVLSQQLADNQKKLEELESFKNPKLLSFQNSCEPLKQILPGIPRDVNPIKWQEIYVRAYGTYAQQESMRGLTNQQILDKYGGINQVPGVCKRADIQQSLDLKEADKMRLKIASWSSKVGAIPPLQMLQSDFPRVFKSEFKINRDGEIVIRSGQQVVGEAFLQFFDKLQDPESVFQLGISLFWMVISLILSVLATILLWALSRYRETKWSFDANLLTRQLQVMQAYQNALPGELERRRRGDNAQEDQS